MTDRDQAPVHIYLLGGFQISRGSITVDLTDWPRQKAASLLKRLALERTLSKDRAIDFLWRSSDPDSAANNLYRTIYTVRRTLDEAFGENLADQVLAFEKGILTLQPKVWVDAHEFQRRMEKHFRGREPKDAEALQRALDLYRGDLLPNDLYAGWTRAPRRELRDLYKRGSVELARFRQQAGDLAGAITILKPLWERDRVDEKVLRRLMQAYAQAGQRSEALRAYRLTARALQDELGVAPDHQTTRLHAQITRGAYSPPPTRTTEPPYMPDGPLVGRDADVSAVRDRLENPLCRLLTLTGPGGIGKTRLAMQVAMDVDGNYEDGVFFVPLAGLGSADLLVSEISEHLAVDFREEEDPHSQLIEALSHKEALLVLDSFEHLLAGVPFLLDLLHAAPGIQVMVTSRERLDVGPEWIYVVEGLSCPPVEAVDQARHSGAVELFLHHLQKLRPSLQLSDSDSEAVARICRLVKGMPLALELAASWIHALSIPAIASAIDGSPDFLATTRRDMPERHQSIRAVFDHSWRLLTRRERSILQNLSIFQGRFHRAAAQQVASASLVDLASLIDKSMLKRAGSGFYELHPLLRQFSLEQLRSQDATARARTRHAHYYADFLRDRETRLKAGSDKQALIEIEQELDNVRLAWDWAVDQQLVAVLDSCLESLALLFQVRGLYHEAIRTFGRAVAAVEDLSGEREARLLAARLLAHQGHIYYRLAHYEQAESLLRDSLSILDELGAPAESAYVYRVQGDIANVRGRTKEAEQHYLKSVAIFRHEGDPTDVARLHSRLGWVEIKLGQYEQASRYLQESLVLFRQMKNQRGMVAALNYLGFRSRREGKYRQAVRYHQQSLSLSREIDFKDGITWSLYELSDDLRDLGEYRAAADRLQESLQVFEEMGSLDRALSLYRLGYLELLLGQDDEAESLLRESRVLFERARSEDGIAWTHYYLGEVALSRRELEQAGERYRSSLALFEQIGDRGNPWGMIKSLLGIGRVARQEKAYERSREYLLRALEMAWALPSVPNSLRILVELATLLADQGRHIAAAYPLAFALHHSASQAETKNLARRAMADLEGQLSKEVLAEASDRATSATIAQLIEPLIHSPSGGQSNHV